MIRCLLSHRAISIYCSFLQQICITMTIKAVNRLNTYSSKWQLPSEDIIACGTADMDFLSADSIINVLASKANKGIFGYEQPSEGYYNSIIGWNKKLFGWDIQKEWITKSPGIWPGLRIMIDAIIGKHKKILTFSPCFHPVDEIVKKSNNKLIKSNLICKNEKYEIDFEDFEAKIKNGVSCFILVNPHNPTGKVFTKYELEKIGSICKKNNVLVLSDEVYSPLVFDGYSHIPFSSIEEFADMSVVFNAVSKPFNLQGLTHALIIIPEKRILNKYNDALKGYDLDFATNIFSLAAVEAAYVNGAAWLKELKELLIKNLEYSRNNLESKFIPYYPEGLFTLWIDCSHLDITENALQDFFINDAKIKPTLGTDFGKEYGQFVRLNFGCSHTQWQTIINRINSAVSKL